MNGSDFLGVLKRFSSLLVLVLLGFSAEIALAQYLDVVAGPSPSPNVAGYEVISPDFLIYLVQSFNGWKGAGIFGGAAIIVQVLIKVMDQPFANRYFSNKSGLTKLGIVAGLTFAITPLGLMSAAGLSVGAALVHSASLTAFTVLVNQIYSQYKTDKDKGKEVFDPKVSER